jgi:alkylation response protein AidB-like acyl-CoA dehydrogenase
MPNWENVYQPTSEQRALADTIGEALVELLPLARLHDSIYESADTWASLTELGLFAIGLNEADGGAGLGVIEEALIAIQLGQQLAHPSIFATICAGRDKFTNGAAYHRVAAGFRSDDPWVVDDPQAVALLLFHGDGSATLHASFQSGEELERQMWKASLAEVTPGPIAAVLNENDVLRMKVINAAALAGLAQGALTMAVGYAKVREQFGRPIGAFQAVKHHCANMAMSVHLAMDQASFAAVALDQEREDAALQVNSAVAIAANAALTTAALNIQIHGGIGFSDEANPHLFLKRARLLSALGGGIATALKCVARAPVNGNIATRGHNLAL